MLAEIDILEHLEGGGWWLRFRSRSTPRFQATKDQLKALLAYPDRLWVPEACNGRGAWYIEERALARIGHLFSNYHLMRWWAEEAERLRAHAAEIEAERQRREAEQRQREQQAMPLRPPTTYQQAFALLGLPVSASRRRIQRTYRQLAQQHHPDHGGSHQMMVALNAAYQLALAYAQANPAA